MKTSTHSRLLACLLLASLAANGWLWQQLRSARHAVHRQDETLAARPFQPAPPPPITPTASQPSPATDPVALPPNTAPFAAPQAASTEPLETAPVDSLLFGQAARPEREPIDESPRGSVTMQRLQELAQARPEPATACEVRSRLLLPGDRWMEFQPGTIAPGQTLHWSKTRDFIYPDSFGFPHLPKDAATGPFPVIPTTPASFTTQQIGLEIELDVEPLGEMLIVGGIMRHTVATSYGLMPGEAFSPITAPAVDADGTPTDIILSDNRIMQPRFSVSESPFTAAASPGTPLRIPVRATFGPTFLEITCNPIP